MSRRGFMFLMTYLGIFRNPPDIYCIECGGNISKAKRDIIRDYPQFDPRFLISGNVCGNCLYEQRMVRSVSLLSSCGLGPVWEL